MLTKEFSDGVNRESHAKRWKNEQLDEQEVMAVDFSIMNELGAITAHQRFDHMIFHGVLTFSSWEYVEVCQSESFEALAGGIQHYFQAMGGAQRTERPIGRSQSTTQNKQESN